MTDRTLALFAAAHDDVKIASPYFIPGERGMAIIRAVGATQDNGRLTLLTNSLGSSDVPLAYEGYAHYRLEMLKAGVRIVVVSDVFIDRGDQFGHAREHPAAQAFGGDVAKESLDQVQPRRRGRREVHVESLVLGEPLLHCRMSAIKCSVLPLGVSRSILRRNFSHSVWR